MFGVVAAPCAHCDFDDLVAEGLVQCFVVQLVACCFCHVSDCLILR